MATLAIRMLQLSCASPRGAGSPLGQGGPGGSSGPANAHEPFPHVLKRLVGNMQTEGLRERLAHERSSHSGRRPLRDKLVLLIMPQAIESLRAIADCGDLYSERDSEVQRLPARRASCAGRFRMSGGYG
jgi:hypothetical protein